LAACLSTASWGFKVSTGLDPFALNAGLMKPRRGFTPVRDKEKVGVGKIYFNIDKKHGLW
jgi:hypothetical protein